MRVCASMRAPWMSRVWLSCVLSRPTLARAHAHRGTVLSDGRTTLGEAALRAGLEVISKACLGPLPVVWARILPYNGESHVAFERLGFRLRTPMRRKDTVEEQVVRALAPDSPWPEPLDPDVLAPVQSDSSALAPPRPERPFRPPEIPRNAPCPCESGAKWKRCCEAYFS